MSLRAIPTTVTFEEIESFTATSMNRPVTFDGLLRECVQEAVGAAVQPRDGQRSLALRMFAAMLTRGQTLDEAPTGSGKSLASLTVAAWMAAEYGERTVISTHNLALLDQYVQKDAPAVVATLANLGVSIKVASVKGVNNYIDPRRAITTAAVLLGEGSVPKHPPVSKWVDRLAQLPDGVHLRARVEQLSDGHSQVDPAQLRDLVVWALQQLLELHADDGDAPAEIADRQTCPCPCTEAEWRLVSSLSSEAAADESDGFGFFPPAKRAKELAAEADIVVTNHVLLALQAAHGIPVVVGSRRLGRIDHIIVDEAHALPGQVRAQGAVEFSGRSVLQIIRAVGQVVADEDSEFRSWRASGDDIAESIERRFARDFESRKSGLGMVVKLEDGDCPAASSGIKDTLFAWLAAAQQLICGVPAKAGSETFLRVMSARDKIDTLRAVVGDVDTHRPGVARWMEQEQAFGSRRAWTKVALSPVSVDGAMRNHLWFQKVVDFPDEAVGDTDIPLRYADLQCALEDRSRLVEFVDSNGKTGWLEPLGVACLSATLPSGFRYDAGISCEAVQHPSPFVEAYAGSLCFVPGLVPDELWRVTKPSSYGSKPRFDTYERHPEFVRHLAANLVRANGGRALVLTAKTSDGKALAEHLRAELDVPVYSQWDGENVAVVKRQWVADEESVLVGTRSLMTGVDAPGETCSLVIVDRPPRSPSNPVDDARVEALIDRSGFSKWDADRLVYVSDAATELQQAVGRLIRSEQDRGAVAVLDPRMLRGSAISYPEPTRRQYMRALEAFPVKSMQVDEAAGWLRARREAGSQAT